MNFLYIIAQWYDHDSILNYSHEHFQLHTSFSKKYKTCYSNNITFSIFHRTVRNFIKASTDNSPLTHSVVRNIWNKIILFIAWCISKEMNNRIFREDTKNSKEVSQILKNVIRLSINHMKSQCPIWLITLLDLYFRWW